MIHGLVTVPLVPLRTSNDETAEMATQLLFGEMVEMIEENNSWILIRNLKDNYIGWVNRKMIQPISESQYATLSAQNSMLVSRPYTLIYNSLLNQSMVIPAGSIIYQPDGADFNLLDESWSLIEPLTSMDKPVASYDIPRIAQQFINAPYLWGGKSIFGIDCSGLVQLVFAIGGHWLPRNASQQVAHGKTVDFITEARAGDLAFFENATNQITHVGIVLDGGYIIHASGKVRIDSIDTQGIKSANGEYTHQLRVIKRLILND